MKVKDFIEKIRPITTLNPDTELNIIYSGDEFNISHIIIEDSKVSIRLN